MRRHCRSGERRLNAPTFFEAPWRDRIRQDGVGFSVPPHPDFSLLDRRKAADPGVWGQRPKRRRQAHPIPVAVLRNNAFESPLKSVGNAATIAVSIAQRNRDYVVHGGNGFQRAIETEGFHA